MKLDYKPLFVKAYEQDLNISRLAQKTGISRGHLSRVKKGSENLSTANLLKVAQVLLIDYHRIGELFEVLEEPEIPKKKKGDEKIYGRRAEDKNYGRRADDHLLEDG
ncbi:MAG: helix-turn-helix transcriptional regulator [SAR324 cluster bacterium]|nr:helix-turn-helix transcriptional regulator [SAR324 cluster bacterium]